MANQTLRQLAKEFAQGNLDKDNYRKSRSELLQDIVSGEVSLEEINFPPPVRPPEPESLDTTERREDRSPAPGPESDNASANAPQPEPVAAAPAASASSPAVAEDESSGKGMVIGIVVVLVLAAIVTVFVMQGDDKTTTTSAGGTTASSAESARMDVTSKAQQLIKDFLANNNWSNESLEQFSGDWANLSNEEITATGETVALGQLTNAIYRQLLEEQALSGLVDDDSSLNKQRQLVEFAEKLGIDDSRIKLPEE